VRHVGGGERARWRGRVRRARRRAGAGWYLASLGPEPVTGSVHAVRRW
jgi:hypothetical protein